MAHVKMANKKTRETQHRSPFKQLKLRRWGDMDISSPLALLPEDGYRAPWKRLDAAG